MSGRLHVVKNIHKRTSWSTEFGVVSHNLHASLGAINVHYMVRISITLLLSLE